MSMSCRENAAFLSPTLAPGRGGGTENKKCSPSQSQSEEAEGLELPRREASRALLSEVSGTEGRLPFTVSPSWRQRPNGSWQETPGASQIEPCAEWSPPSSPIEQGHSKSGETEYSASWRISVASVHNGPGSEHFRRDSDNDENANCNANQSTRHLQNLSAAPEEPLKKSQNVQPSDFFASEAVRRPSVLSRRLSVVPNVLSSPS